MRILLSILVLLLVGCSNGRTYFVVERFESADLFCKYYLGQGYDHKNEGYDFYVIDTCGRYEVGDTLCLIKVK